MERRHPHLAGGFRRGEVRDVDRMLAAVVDPEGDVARGVDRLVLAVQLALDEAPVDGQGHPERGQARLGGDVQEQARRLVGVGGQDVVGNGGDAQHVGDGRVGPLVQLIVEAGRHRHGGGEVRFGRLQ